MKRQNFKLSIQHPCSQKWDEMTINQSNKFCEQCSKHVIDFTSLNDSELVSILENSTGKICGRLNKQQLNRIIHTSKPKPRIQLNQLFASLLLITPIKNSLANPIKSNTQITTSHQEVHELKKHEPIKDSLKNTIRGVVIDATTKEPLPFVRIILKETTLGTMSDFDGKFIFKVPDSLITEKTTLIISTIAYEKHEFTFNQNDFPINREFLIIASEEILLGDVYIEKKKKWWQF